jgi:8-oxo-dGTP pyrophosphatase MutT (NUDIX family)
VVPGYGEGVTVRRSSARVVVVDANDRVLLLRGGDPRRPARPVWHTPGGGIDPGETPEHAALRELTEEIGLEVSELGSLVWKRRFVFMFDGVEYDQDEVFYLLRVESHEVDTSRQTPLERRYISGHRWFSVPELLDFDELVAPPDLADRLDELLRQGPPATPVAVGGAVLP